MCVLN